MTKTAKALLVAAIVCLVLGGIINIGLINPGKLDALYVLLPLGAVFLGLFLIVLVLGKEGQVHDQDQHLAEPANEGSAKPLPPGVGSDNPTPTPGGKSTADKPQ